MKRGGCDWGLEKTETSREAMGEMFCAEELGVLVKSMVALCKVRFLDFRLKLDDG